MVIVRIFVGLMFSAVLLGHVGWGVYKNSDSYQIVDVDDDEDGEEESLS